MSGSKKFEGRTGIVGSKEVGHAVNFTPECEKEKYPENGRL
jgi:hypothetical protein